MRFQIYSTSGYMKQYIDKLKKYNLVHDTRIEKIKTGSVGRPQERKYEDYFIEMKDLQELCDLSNELNQQIILWNDCLEIYDDYRE